MALLIYFDAGGDESRPALSAGGWIAREEQWRAFDIDWSQALLEAGVTELHMKHFAHSRGEFKGWKGKETKRAAFLAQLAGIIKKHTIRHVAVTLQTSVYHALNKEATVEERLGSPYVMTMLSAIVFGQLWRDKEAQSEPLAFFVEHGDKGQGALIDVLKRLEFPHPVTPLAKRSIETDGSVRYVFPFQAADFLAYEYHKGISTMRDRRVTEIVGRKSLRALLPIGEDEYSRVIDVHGLGELCMKCGVRRRPKR